MTVPPPDEMERLASRLALLTSDEGEAENAGRAVGQLARRLGLSGGDLKAIFLAGSEAAAMAAQSRALQGVLDRTDAERAAALRHLAAAQDQAEALREQLDRARTSLRVARVLGVVAVVAVVGGGALTWLAGPLRLSEPAPSAGSPLRRMAMAGAGGTDLYRQPDAGTDPAGHLPPGVLLPVRQLVWHGLTQWVETEQAGQAAFAPATQVDLR